MKNKFISVVGFVLSCLISLQFAFSAAAKLFPDKLYPQMPEQLAKIGLPESIIPTIAALEIICVVIYLIPTTAVLGAILFTGYLGGAILTHLRVGENVFLQVTLGILIWLGVYLREPHLRELLPFRKKK